MDLTNENQRSPSAIELACNEIQGTRRFLLQESVQLLEGLAHNHESQIPAESMFDHGADWKVVLM